ncbi:uncharacterized protein LOC114543202 [Dendronephthya gigantea]|uniref:uncharacterized protein LOC114543202 n=1 Tax=Dendronephthya gigantea TaxID=151771 RepID=UPI00106D3C6F|nr:uncharacterized protein LOC114543202 [Dendronephthya gigantea]
MISISSIVLRSWEFRSTNVTTPVMLASITRDGSPTIFVSFPVIAVEKPSTLILQNVDHRYDGKYRFTVSAFTAHSSSEVVVFVAEKPTVTLNCSSPVTLNEGENFACLCRGEGGNPPANVTWFKNGVKITDVGIERQTLKLSNISRTDNGTYKCKATSYPHQNYTDEKSYQVIVYGPQETDVPIDSPCRPFYNKTNLPQDSIEMAHYQMHPFYPLVYTYCSVNLLPLICSIYLPVLDNVSSKILPPCWDLCDQVSMDCSYAIRKLKFPISTLLQRCSSKSAPGNATSTKCFRPTAAPTQIESDQSCCFTVKPHPFCIPFFGQSSLNSSQQDEVIFSLSTYLPLFHALESLNQQFCVAKLSEYLCLKKFQYCDMRFEEESGGCSPGIFKVPSELCSYITDASSPCSLSRINTTLQNAGYNIPIIMSDFHCSTLQSSIHVEEHSSNIPLLPQISSTVALPFRSSAFYPSRVSRSIKSEASGNVVTTSVLNSTVSPGDISATLSARPSSQHIEIGTTNRPWLPQTTKSQITEVFVFHG